MSKLSFVFSSQHHSLSPSPPLCHILAALTDSQCSSCSQSHGDNIMPYNHAFGLSLSLGCPPCRCHCASHSRSLTPMPLCLPVTFSYHFFSLSWSFFVSHFNDTHRVQASHSQSRTHADDIVPHSHAIRSLSLGCPPC